MSEIVDGFCRDLLEDHWSGASANGPGDRRRQVR